MDLNNQFPIDQPETEKRIISQKGWKWFWTVLALILATTLATILLEVGLYGWALFFAVPFTAAFVIGFIHVTRKSNPLIIKSLFIATGILILLGLLLIAFKAEGGICFIMAAFFVMIPILMGVLLGQALGKAHLTTQKTYFWAVLLLFNPAIFAYDYWDESRIEDTAATFVRIQAPPQKIWQILTHKVIFGNSHQFFLKAGVNYPLDMELQKEGPQCFLKCNTLTGFVHLRADSLIENKKMLFRPTHAIIPMREWSFYGHLDAKHLHGYFLNDYGAFEIEELGNGQCKLWARTHYTYKITPVWYWSLWSNYLLNVMHQNV